MPSKPPKVSVVVPVYNTSAYLKQCLDSLLAQTLSDIEIICVDDGSTDSSGEILDSYARSHAKITVIHQKNAGVGTAYNVGVKHSKGEYVGFLDSDDWADKEMYKELSAVADKHHPDIVKAGYFEYFSDSDIRPTVRIPAFKAGRVISDMTEVSEFVRGHISHWSAIYKRSFLVENDIWHSTTPGANAQDVTFIYKCWICARSFYALAKPFVYYRQHPASSICSKHISWGLLDEHVRLRDFMRNCPLITPKHWHVKARNEFEYYTFEYHVRLEKRRYDFLRQVARVFRENLQSNCLNKSYFTEEEYFRYQFIAYFPLLYHFNDIFCFWKTVSARDARKKYRLFGLWRSVKTPDSYRVYILGLRVWSGYVYGREFMDLNRKISDLSREVHALSALLRNKHSG